MGTIGHGKSNFLNRLAGRDLFVSKKSIKGVTQEPELTKTKDFAIIDTPGLNDARIDTREWVERYNNADSATGSISRLDLAILLFKANPRPSNND